MTESRRASRVSRREAFGLAAATVASGSVLLSASQPVAAAPSALYLLLSLAAFSWLVRYR